MNTVILGCVHGDILYPMMQGTVIRAPKNHDFIVSQKRDFTHFLKPKSCAAGTVGDVDSQGRATNGVEKRLC